ncbi:MAG: YceI family protein [Gammaproteobacteria bacterium]
MRIRLALALLASGAAHGQPDADPHWRVHDDSSLEFVAFQQGAEFTGRFEQFDAMIRFDPGALDSSRLSISVDTDSVNTFYDDRDEILREADLLDVERWPTASFVSDDIRDIGESRFEASGDLTIRDQTHRIHLPFSFEIVDNEALLGGEIAISRLHYGVGQGDWSNTEWVGDDVTVRVRLRLEAPLPVTGQHAPVEVDASK